MNFEPEIELYAEDGMEVIYDLLTEKLGNDIVKVEKKLEHYQHVAISNLLATKTLDFINGTRNPRLYEFKIKSLSRPIRFVCSIEGKTIVLLDVLFTSGSSGAAEKHVQRSAERLMRWRSWNQN